MAPSSVLHKDVKGPHASEPYIQKRLKRSINCRRCLVLPPLGRRAHAHTHQSTVSPNRSQGAAPAPVTGGHLQCEKPGFGQREYFLPIGANEGHSSVRVGVGDAVPKARQAGRALASKSPSQHRHFESGVTFESPYFSSHSLLRWWGSGTGGREGGREGGRRERRESVNDTGHGYCSEKLFVFSPPPSSAHSLTHSLTRSSAG